MGTFAGAGLQLAHTAGDVYAVATRVFTASYSPIVDSTFNPEIRSKRRRLLLSRVRP